MGKEVTRRGAMKALGVLSVASAIRVDAQVAPPWTPSPAALGAIAEVVLPTELGASGRADAVEAFVRWLRNYKEGADTDHGYGNTRIRATGPSPVRSYQAQLAALDTRARATGASEFAAAPLADRRRIIEQAIDDAKIVRLPSRPSGAHIALDLMGHYFSSSSAADLCYRAAIGRDTCRGLPDSEKPPAPLRGDPRLRPQGRGGAKSPQATAGAQRAWGLSGALRERSEE